MEFIYFNKLKIRKVILGEDDGIFVRDDEGVEEK